MRVLLDEDVPIQLLEPLRRLIRPEHTAEHVTLVSLQGRKDIPLLNTARQQGYEVFVTADLAQMSDPGEIAAIASSDLHHVRFAQKPGRRGLALALAGLIAALPDLLDELEGVQGQRLVRIVGLDPRQRRYQITDPSVDPPAYWPRRTTGRRRR